MCEVREGRDGAEGLLRPPHEEVLSGLPRALALATAMAVLVAACAAPLTPAPLPIAPPAPARHVPPLDDPADRARFECAVEVQRAQNFDPGASLARGSVFGGLLGAGGGAALGALFGAISDAAGSGAAVGAIAGGGAGAMIGGQLALDSDSAAYARGLEACLAAHAAGTWAPSTPTAETGLVEYRLRVLSLPLDAFTSYLSPPELADGAVSPGLMQLAADTDAGALPRGVVLYDRHVAPASQSVDRAFGATVVDARVKLGGGKQDYWDEARWLGHPGDRTVWIVTPRSRRAQELRRIGLSDVTALAQFRPTAPPLMAGGPEASVTVPLPYLRQVEEGGAASAWLERALDRSRGIAGLVAVNDDAAFPDRVYLVVTHAIREATYEAVLAWGERGGVERGHHRD